MVFIDGENLVFRYQTMSKKGRIPKPGVIHIEDVLVWTYGVYTPGDYDILRANYYTYAIGDDERIADINMKLKQLAFLTSFVTTLPRTLTPIVFRKPKQSAKAKGVDIQLTVDVLSHVHRDNLDAIFLLTGDGDYAPLIEEVLRCGKQVYIGAFSDGLNPKLVTLADEFYSLDNIFFENQPNT